jgi:hypothetical protein
MENDNKEYTPLKLDPKLKEEVKKAAAKENRSVNNYIETALIEKTGFKDGKVFTPKKEYKDNAEDH